MGTVFFDAVGVNRQGVVGNGKTLELGDSLLALFYLGVVKLFDLAAVQAHQMVMVLALVDFIHRLAGLEIAAVEQARLLELRQHPVHRGQADVGALF